MVFRSSPMIKAVYIEYTVHTTLYNTAQNSMRKAEALWQSFENIVQKLEHFRYSFWETSIMANSASQYNLNFVCKAKIFLRHSLLERKLSSWIGNYIETLWHKTFFQMIFDESDHSGKGEVK